MHFIHICKAFAVSKYCDSESVSTHVSKLHDANLTKLRHRRVSRLGLDEHLTQCHLLAAKHRTHLGWFFELWDFRGGNCEE